MEAWEAEENCPISEDLFLSQVQVYCKRADGERKVDNLEQKTVGQKPAYGCGWQIN